MKVNRRLLLVGLASFFAGIVATFFIAIILGTCLSNVDQNEQIEKSEEAVIENEKPKVEKIEVEKPKEEVKEEVILKVDYNKVIKDYNDNEVKADNTYKNKLLELEFKIDNIAKDVLDITYITSDSIGLTSLQCYFLNKNEINKVANLNKGDIIILVGRCTGKTFNISIDDCKIK